MLKNTLIQKISNSTANLQGSSVSVLRLDLLHPIVSGNKIFKLKNYIELALKEDKKTLITFGGAYSNHLVATAFAAREHGLHAIGYVRGEKPSNLSSTLKDCIEYGMELKFISRSYFDRLQHDLIHQKQQNAVVIPYGGYGRLGALGAKEILNFEEANSYDLIIASCGSGTMAAGLLSAITKSQQLILVSAIKNNFSIKKEILTLLEPQEYEDKTCVINHDYHFGGFAKKNNHLLDYMNDFFIQTGIPTDFVYTGKLMYALNDMLVKGSMPNESNILLIHSGGLQGNRSLKNNELIFLNEPC